MPDTATPSPTNSQNTISFYLNGVPVMLDNPSPDMMLIDYLKAPEQGLAGPKKPCGQGGCGGCTVIMSSWDDDNGAPQHTAINACLRPIAAVQGQVITTIEGTGTLNPDHPPYLQHTMTGSRIAAPLTAPTPPALKRAQEQAKEKRERVAATLDSDVAPDGAGPLPGTVSPSGDVAEGVNPVAWRLAVNNGTQCGYCTVGFVMTMSEFLTNNPSATKREIEGALDGNICRCTGYRAILTGMKSFASDWSAEDEAARMLCDVDPDTRQKEPKGPLVLPFPDAARKTTKIASIASDGRVWMSPQSLAELAQLKADFAGRPTRMVAGNTGYGIYKEAYDRDAVMLNLAGIAEIHGEVTQDGTTATVPAATTYTEFIAALEAVMIARGEPVPSSEEGAIEHALTRLGALYFLSKRTAGHIVRNAATVAGNTMLMLHNIAGQDEPFPSDLGTGLLGIGAAVTYIDLSDPSLTPVQVPYGDLIASCAEETISADNLLLINFEIPLGSEADMVLPQKVALREVNAHSIVNAVSCLTADAAGVVSEAVLSFGALAPFAWRARQTEAAMIGEPLSLDALPGLLDILRVEVSAVLEQSRPRSQALPWSGFTDTYKCDLALTYFYKTYINAMMSREPASVPAELRSAGEITWGQWPVSHGRQDYSRKQDWKAPVAKPYIKTMALEQASGQVHYAHELPVPSRTVFAAPVQSRRALATWGFQVPGGQNCDAEDLLIELHERFEGFIDIVTEDDIPAHGINLQGMGSDQPVVCPLGGQVNYVGQTLFLICARTETDAQTIADYVTQSCIAYADIITEEGDPEWWSEPVLSIEQAIAQGSIYPDYPNTAPFNSHIWKVTRPGTDLSWADIDRDPLERSTALADVSVDGVPCALVQGAQETGGQIHFYMEPQAALAEPTDKNVMVMHPSTQSPMEMHQSTAMILGSHYNRVEVRVPQVGGGFGGKTEQTRFVAAATALAASKLKRPVRMALTREQDTGMIGKRHAYYGQYQIAVDKGEMNPADKGRIRGFLNRMWGDGGAFYDCSFIVSNCIQTRADAAYRITNFQNQIDVCRTNHAPSTAMRAFGDVQCKVIVESAVADAAHAVGMRPEDVREKNLYQRGDSTPFGQALTYCYMDTVWDYLKEKADFEAKSASVQAFNARNKWRKRGIAMMPVKYGSGYNLAMLEQATAMISIYQADGTVVIHQGGVEMGQGLITQMRQIAAYVLNIPLDMVLIKAPITSVIPNPTSTGGSTGTAYNGEAVKQLCARMRSRLTDFANGLRDQMGPEWCAEQGIDYWNHPEKGWQAEVPSGEATVMIWQKLTALAYQYRIGLTDTFTAPVKGGDVQSPALSYKPFADQPTIPDYTATDGVPGEFDNFVGFTYSGACAVVEVDILTGETKILSSDLVYDMGWSLNPAVDIGQVEGAFVQGVGYLLTEKLVFQPDGDQKGALNTLNTWTYKPPAVTTIPIELNTHLFPRDLASDVPESPYEGVLSSKEVGEPPLVLATSVFLAVREAIRASRIERGLDPFFRLDAPATVQDVRTACAVQLGEI
ncbi:molybdopterin cofactor-binding domain-containing protein [Pontivivens insulae]|uniref:Xanthine dehydrogenase molybdenum-binding subunit XdhA n=1 Tax=Pontivivens insulae TaxID=1639689 RepID=A0A2R8AGD1_9RHOB|nr:molybdopterin cofactor-binding domain-containing protein [Pontivivens insulae]RED10642.1 xanthine dehydrogenase/oxidase [Pontivivens insulae]SPF31148.1 Putative xanthine dehydrogenase molybdenum-binding subunit XdhA [Pontivivens insulae]